jgi:hypothetical protein
MHFQGSRYACRGRRQGNGCPASMVRDDAITDAVGAFLRGLAFLPDTRQRTLAAYQQN